jgi:hypothetical protein
VPDVFRGRYQAQFDAPLVVFGIGMRINRPLAVHRWLKPTINTVRNWWHVQHYPPEGYLNGYLYVYAFGVGMTQYWRDFDALEAYSHDTTQPHVAAWRQLARLTKNDQTFGYWHETYVVTPDNSETIYGSMPRFGLAAATRHVSVVTATNAARARLDGDGHDAAVKTIPA